MFKNRSCYIKVTSVIGHVYTTDFPLKYYDRNRVDPKDLFDAETEKKESNPKAFLSF